MAQLLKIFYLLIVSVTFSDCKYETVETDYFETSQLNKAKEIETETDNWTFLESSPNESNITRRSSHGSFGAASCARLEREFSRTYPNTQVLTNSPNSYIRYKLVGGVLVVTQLHADGPWPRNCPTVLEQILMEIDGSKG